jgi:long-subunit fatty acid transport protein
MRKTFKTIPVILLELIFAVHLQAQTNEASGWFFLSHTQKLADKWSYMTDVQIRSSSHFKYLQNILLRPGLLYQLTDQQSLGIGYTYFATWDRSEMPCTFEPESRIFEQYVYKSKGGRLALNNRLRFEQRFIQKTEATIFARRLRYQIQARFQLTCDSEFATGLYVNLQNEIFLNVQNQDEINNHFFDQNRLYLGMGYRVIKEFEVELGYYYRYQILEDSRLNENIIQLMIITEF